MRILIVEDDQTLAEALVASLTTDNHEASYALTAAAGEAALVSNPDGYDLLILDWSLPDRDGVELARELRLRHLDLPILLLTGKAEADDKVLGLASGADDYLTKPFAIPELLARLKALGRRPKKILSPTLTLGNLTLDTEKKKLFYENKEIPLTLKEFSIVEYLCRHPNQVLTREDILDHVWDYDFDSFSNIVDVHINNLRKKIAAAGSAPVLETIRGDRKSVV